MEHRWGHRHEISRDVRLHTRGGIAARGRIVNVSISGAYIVSPLPVHLLSHLQVQFRAMLEGHREMITLQGQVVRKDSNGFALEWSEFAPDVVRAIVMVPPFRATEPPQPVWESVPAEAGHRGRSLFSGSRPSGRR